jgi:signal transduction histidine kinase
VGNVFVDRGQLEQVVLNLAMNARDATNGSGTLSFEIGEGLLDEEHESSQAGEAHRTYVVLSVIDTGRGIPRNIQPRIFEPFFTTKGDAGRKGLGLAVVYGVVEQSGGHVSLYSEEGKGTTFKVYLPKAGAVGPKGADVEE